MNKKTDVQTDVLESLPAVIDYPVVTSLTEQITEAAEAITVKDQATYDTAVGMGKALSLMKAANAEHHDPMIRAANLAHKETTKAKKRWGEPIESALSTLRTKCAGHVRQQQELERKETLRLEAEKKKRDEAAALREAERLEKAGADKETVDNAMTEPAPAPPPPPAAAPRVAARKGVSVRKNWKVKVTDPMKLIRAVAEGKANASLVVPDMQALNKLAKALEKNFDVPGVEAFDDATASFSGK